ncbi:hypothetical protein GGR21_003527 [Dysgonomonas hofstadii]|uniref:Uncharacterized protein n=1 Tax=Dysgonomonas hofstadii TaxID=637886 RepID=A0A840CNE4_9BACT|nr:hypothetical protein [Dysgonomonas hofstadii]MBB4037607.1 hypothetical protein [Dysgonomonas hofstadii]
MTVVAKENTMALERIDTVISSSILSRANVMNDSPSIITVKNRNFNNDCSMSANMSFLKIINTRNGVIPEIIHPKYLNECGNKRCLFSILINFIM